jgi:hypothetical protein
VGALHWRLRSAIILLELPSQVLFSLMGIFDVNIALAVFHHKGLSVGKTIEASLLLKTQRSCPHATEYGDLIARLVDGAISVQTF